MRVRWVARTAVAAVVVTAAGMAGHGSAGAVSPPPTVVSVDDANSEYVSAGGAPTKVRAGRFDVFPWLSSLDGQTWLWEIGTTFRQIALVHNGTTVRTLDDRSGDFFAGDVSPDGTQAVVALEEDVVRGTYGVSVLSTGGASSLRVELTQLEDVGWSGVGSQFFVITATNGATLNMCSTSCDAKQLTGINLAAADSYVAWSSASADGLSLIMDVVTNASTTPHHEAYVVTGTVTPMTINAITVRDAGTIHAGTVGRFLGNEFDLADPQAGVLSTYATAADFGTATHVDTPMTFTGSPQTILSPGAAPNTAFTAPAVQLATQSTPLVAPAYTVAKSTTVYISTRIALRPAVWNPPGGTWPYYYWNKRSCYLLYSFDKGAHWSSFPWYSQDFPVARNVWVRASHAAEINAKASVSAVVQYTARPYLVVHYTSATRRLYGTANIPNGFPLQIQRRTSTGSWTTYLSHVPVTSYAWSVTLPGAGTWRVYAPATSIYAASASAAVTSH